MTASTVCSLSYGDLHFHTRYSDNADRATVGEMTREGIRRGLSILGTGDHNHNLTAAAWERQRAESAEVRRRCPGIVLLNSCEITFLLGHFIVFEPGPVDGTIAEGYRFLFGVSARGSPLKMINHPGLPTDEWNTRIVPDAAAMELINGAVLREASAHGISARDIRHPMQIPSLVTYARYLSAGVPLAALGSSDAHRIDELGQGVTGFWLAGPPSARTVLDAVRSRRTFAATDTKARLEWNLGEDGGISWDAGFPSEEEVQSWLFIDDRLLREAGRRGTVGRQEVACGGNFWIAARCGDRWAVSSAVPFGAASAASTASCERAMSIRRAAARHLVLDRSLLEWEDLSGSVGGMEDTAPPTEIEIRAVDPSPVLEDAAGRKIGYEIVRATPARALVEKEGSVESFGEFDVWLQRNEVHECRLEGVRYHREGDTFIFEAFLLPFVLDKRPGVDARYQEDIHAIHELLPGCAIARLNVSLMPLLRLRIVEGAFRLPFRVRDSGIGAMSEVHALRLEAVPEQFPEGWHGALPPKGERCFAQFFVQRTLPRR